MSTEAMKQDFETWWYNEGSQSPYTHHDCEEHTKRMCEIAWNNGAYKAIEQAEKQEPVVMWLILDRNINHLQVDSIQRLIDRAKHAHMTDIKLRINGQDEWYEADWLKHMTRTSPPKREWVGLTMDEIDLLEELYAPPVHPDFTNDSGHCLELIRHVEAKLKEKNGLS